MDIKVEKVTITNITQDDLVDFLSTALYGNPSVGTITNPEDTKSVFLAEQFDQLYPNGCYEEKLAYILLNHGTVYITDLEAYDDDEFFVPEGKLIRKLHAYPINLARITAVLETIYQGLRGNHLKKSFESIFINPGEGDMYDAYNILQSIAYNDVVYG